MDDSENNLFGPSYWELYKRLEINNFVNAYSEDHKIKKRTNSKLANENNVSFEKTSTTVGNLTSKLSTFESQYQLFARSMRLVYILGQCLGLNPLTGILKKDFREMKFKLLSWKMLYCLIIFSYQALGTFLSFYRICKFGISTKFLTYVTHYGTSCVNTFLFIFVARKWPNVIREITFINLDEYVDPRLKVQCTIVVFAVVIISIAENTLSVVAKCSHILDCTPNAVVGDAIKVFTMERYNNIFEIGSLPYGLPLGILFFIFNIITTITWNYAHIFISCISLYAISIFDNINKKIKSAQNKSLQPWFWRSVREDYTRTTRLVRMFDDVISGLIFVALTNDVCYLCLNTFNILQNSAGQLRRFNVDGCPNYPSGPFHGKEYSIYFTFSLVLIMFRFLMLSLLGSRVHTAAAQPSITLHGVPTQVYCSEMQRLIEQIHSNEVALTGLQFFKITKSLILSVAGTIVTYELVLMQLDN